jgi:nucleotidyltransferase/DNA polymerase involved in DNA repair
MHRAAWGQDDSPVVTESEPVSMSRETTFERDLHAVRDRAELGRIFTDLCQRVAQDLQRKGYVGAPSASSCAMTTFKSVTRDHTIAEPTPMPPPSAVWRGCASSACRWTGAAAAGRARGGAAAGRLASMQTPRWRVGHMPSV